MPIKTRHSKKTQAVCFSSFSNSHERLNAYAKQVKVNEFIEEEKIESMFGEED